MTNNDVFDPEGVAGHQGQDGEHDDGDRQHGKTEHCGERGSQTTTRVVTPVGALLLGPLFAAILAANAVWLTDLPGSVVAIGFVFFALCGPFLVWVIRRNVGRWDAAHPN